MTTTAGPGERTAGLEHEIGAQGELSLRIPDGDLDVRGVEGSVVRIRDLEGQATLSVRRAVGRLEVGLADDDPGDARPRWLRLGRSGRARLEVEVPHGAHLGIEVTSAAVRVVGVDGDQRCRTISGGLEFRDAGGSLTIDGVSGDVTVVARSSLALRVQTVSGDLRVTAPLLRELHVGTMSGDTRIEGPLGAGEHRIETVSGDAVLIGAESVTVAASTISGGIATDLAHHVSGGRGRQVLLIGDGAARLTFRSLSGDLDVLRRPPDHAAPKPVPSPGAASDAEPAHAPDRRHAVPPDARLDLLCALERGEIDVDEAARRLAALDEEVADA
jgi:Toastrack DUF4097